MSAYDRDDFPTRTTFTKAQIQVIKHVMGNAMCNLDPAGRCVHKQPGKECEALFGKYHSAMAKLEGMVL